MNEHKYILNKMQLIEREILSLALEALSKNLLLSDDLVYNESFDNEGSDVVIKIMNIDFLCEIKENITSANFNVTLKYLQEKSDAVKTPIILITKYINPNLLKKFTANKVNVLDCAGNFFIRYEKANKLVFSISNKGEKNIFSNEKVYQLFQEAGIKVIFYLLQDKKNVSKTYRDIKEVTGVALGSVKNVIAELISRKFVIVTENGRLLKNYNSLLELWVENYNQVLKPKLLLSTMGFRGAEQRLNWKQMLLPEGMFWGGEGAVNLIDNYLLPENFDIYTDVPTAYLMKTGLVSNNVNGEIKIYKKFWNWKTEKNIVPKILIYADLMGSGNSRCLEAANRLLQYGLNDFCARNKNY